MKNEKIVLSYGELPEFTSFLHQYLETCKHMDFVYSLIGPDKQLAKDVGIPDQGSFKGVELYTVIERLINAYEGGNEKAGELAASFMTTLGYEWI